jgi:predicted ATPase/signal transduction histidine kinase
VDTITLGPLTREHCIQLLSDALSRDAADVEPLAHLCLRKTGGNPFFLGQFLLSLYDEGLIHVEERTGRWTWDMERLARTPMTDNVVALMAAKLQKLPEDAQRVLRLAACIGNTFDLKTLAIVDARSPGETADSLWAGLREGLILPLGDAYKFVEDRSAAADLVTVRDDSAERVTYRFLHDRVQQAAYSLIPDDRKREVHLQIGRLTLSGLQPEERDEHIFTIVGHLNAGAELMDTRAERDELALLNLLAAQKAQASAAHTAAKGYLEAGILLLGPERWTRRPELALPLHTQAVVASFLSTDFESMERHAAEVLQHAQGPLAQAKVYEIRVQAYILQNRLQEAVRTARQILALLGIEFPAQPTMQDIGAAIEETRAAVGGRRIEELIDLAPMTDPVMQAATRILTIITSAAYVANPLLFPLIVLRQLIIATQYGNTGSLTFGFGAYGIILAGALNDFDSAYAYGKLALRVHERYEAREYISRTHFNWNMFIRLWKEHARETLRGFQEVYRTGLEVGDLEYAGWGALLISTQALATGQELAEVDRGAGRWSRAIAQIRQQSALNYNMIVQQTVQNLMGASPHPCRLVGAVYDEEAMLPLHREKNDAYGLATFFIYKLQLCYLFGSYPEALAYATQAEPYVGAVTASVHVPTFVLFDTLTRLELHPTLSEAEREQALKRIDESVARMRLWAEHAPMNYGAKHALLEAERHRVLGEAERARAEYYRAIALAREHEYRNDEALATERFAAFLRERGENEVARLFLAKARHLYHLWGAEAKVRDIERTFPDLRAGTPSASRAPLATTRPTSTITTSEGARSGRALDLVSVLKASQAISGEMVLTELLKKLMRILVENAGARWGVLILEGDRPLLAVAKHSSRDEAGLVTLHESGEASPVEFSLAIVRYVERTHEVVVLGDASEAEAFHSDPYVVAHRPKSVLCMPILHQKKRAGILYLENELVANAFTQEHCQVLSLLAAQAAISLENAKLYDTLDTRVKERTRELSETLQRLQETQKQLVLQEKLASLGSLTSGIAHEIKNPLNFVNNFAELTVSLVSELREELKPPGGAAGARSLDMVQELLGDLESNATKIREHGTRADRIVRAMLEHARTGPGTTRQVHINELVREYVNLAVTSHRARGGHTLTQSVLRTEFDAALGVATVASEDLGRVILNLTNNALYALEARGSQVGSGFAPLLTVTTRDLGERFEIRIRDNGGGVPAQAREKIFTPFFTTKPPGQGTGLGLSISHDIIVQGHGGTLAFTSEEGEGTEFVVALPKRTDERPP